MKTIRFPVLRITVGVFFVSLLLASASQAQTVILDGTTATGIEGLQVNQVSFYDVTFLTATANTVYGTNPNQIFPFPGSAEAELAAVAVNIALDMSVADRVGEADPGERVFNIGWGVNEAETGIWATNGTFVNTTNNWIGPGDRELISFGTAVVYAVFTKVSPPDTQPLTADAGGPYNTSVGVEATYNGSASQPAEGGSIVSYAWDFGEGGTATGEIVTYTYTEDGVFDVTLVVTDDTDATDDDVTEATVAINNLPPVANTGGPYSGLDGNPVAFDASGSSDPEGGGLRYDWVWGDGEVSSDTGVTTTHIYNTTADTEIFNANLTVTDAGGLQDTDGTQVTIGAANQPPTANAGGPYDGVVAVAVAFDGTGSVDPDGQISSYDWNYGDDSPIDVDAGPTPSHSYAASGTWTVTLTVSDAENLTGSDETVAVIIVESNEPPVADAGGPYNGEVGVPVTLDATASMAAGDGEIVQYDWNYGDGTDNDVDAGPTPSHTYDTAGTFSAVVTVTDNNDLTDSASGGVSISAGAEPPIADAGGPYSGVTGVAVDFDGTLSADLDGEIVQYDWDYGDSTGIDVDAGPTPSHIYTDAGTGPYTVTLTVTDDDSLTDTDGTTASIDQPNQPPMADANGPYTGTVNVAVTFDATASTDDGEIVQYDWDYGDGTPVADNVGPTPSHAYATEGLFRPVVIVTDDVGLQDATGSLVYIAAPVNNPPVADANGPYTGTVDVAVTFDATASTDDVVRYDWNYGDGTVVADDVGPTPSHIYTTEGLFRAVVYVTDDVGLQDATGSLVFIDLPAQDPVADAGGPYTGAAGVAVNFDGSASIDPDGDITQYDWDYDDGSLIDLDAGPTPSHVYADSGVYNPTLTVTDNDFRTGSDETSASIGAGNQAPLADAGGPYPGVKDIAVTFDGTGSRDPDGGSLVYSWDFGDGSSLGSGASPTHTYTTAGVRNVILTVTDDEATPASDSAAALIASGTTPPVAATGGPYEGSAGVPVYFDGTDSSDPDGGKLRYAWDFGDDTTASGAMPTHTYAVNGTFDVTLTVIDDSARTDTDSTSAVTQAMADLGVESVVTSPTPLSVNGELTYSITIANYGADDEPAATAEITIPANSTLDSVSTTQGNCEPLIGLVVCDLGAVLDGGSVTITMTVIAPAQPMLLTTNVTVSGQLLDPNVANNNSESITNVAEIISIQGKSKKGGGAFGVIELLLFGLAVALMRIRRIRRTNFAWLLSTCVLFGLMLGSPNTSQAQDSSWYIGAGAGATTADFATSNFAADMAALGHTVSNVNVDDSSDGLKLYGGYNFNEYFATELAYVDLGEVSASFDGFSNDPEQMLQDAAGLLPVLGDGFSVSALGRYPFGERFAIFAKVGAYFWESDVSVTGGVTAPAEPKADGTDFAYGVGGDLYFGGKFGLRLEWERYALDPNDVDFVSASLLWRF